jgi:hypothetical protein
MLASLLTLGLSAFAYAIPTTELVQRAGPDLSQVFLHMVSWDGTGCPKESNNVGNYTSSDKQTLVFESYKFSINRITHDCLHIMIFPGSP